MFARFIHSVYFIFEYGFYVEFLSKIKARKTTDEITMLWRNNDRMNIFALKL